MIGGTGYKKKENNLFEEMRCYMDQVVKQQVVEQLAREKAREKKKEKLCHDDIPKFQGGIQPEEFLDWLSVVDEVFMSKEVPEKKKVSLVATRLRGHALAWWRQTKSLRERQGKKKIDSWNKMKKHLRAGFLPHNYAWAVTQQAYESQYEQNEGDLTGKKTVVKVFQNKGIKLKRKVMWTPSNFDCYMEGNWEDSCAFAEEGKEIEKEHDSAGVESIGADQSLKENGEVFIEKEAKTWFCEKIQKNGLEGIRLDLIGDGQNNKIEDATVKKDVEGELILVVQHGEIIDFVGVEISNFKVDKKLIDFVNWLKFHGKQIWIARLNESMEFYRLSTRMLWSIYLFVWIGEVQYQANSGRRLIVCMTDMSHVIQLFTTSLHPMFVMEKLIKVNWNRPMSLRRHVGKYSSFQISIGSYLIATWKQTTRYGVEVAGIIVKGLGVIWIWIWILHVHVDHHKGLARIINGRHDSLKGTIYTSLFVTRPRRCEGIGESNTVHCVGGKSFIRTRRLLGQRIGSNLFAEKPHLQDYWKRPGNMNFPVPNSLQSLLNGASLDHLSSVPGMYYMRALFADLTNRVGRIRHGQGLVYSLGNRRSYKRHELTLLDFMLPLEKKSLQRSVCW